VHLAYASAQRHAPSGSDRAIACDPLFFFVVFVNGDGFEILGFEDLAAIQTFNIIHAVASHDDHGAGVLTGLHKTDMGFILMMAILLSRGILT